MLEVARLLAVYDADTRGFDQKSKDVENTLERLSGGSVFGGFVGAQIFMQAANALGGLAVEGVQAYASFERLGMSLQTLSAREAMSSGAAKNMGQALAMSSGKASELVGWIQQLAVKSPFTREGVATAFRQAMAYGFTTEQTQRLTQAMIDFAAGSGASEGAMSQIALALGQIQAKGRLAGQEILQLVNAGIPVQQILADAFGKSTAEIAKMTEQGLIPANAAIEAIVQSLERDFGGAAERQATSVAGLISSLSDLKDINLTAFFGGFFEEVQPYLTEFVDALSDPAMQENMAALGKSAGELAVTLIEGGKEILSIWNSIPEPLRGAAIALISIEAATPPLMDALGRGAIALQGWGSALKSLPGFYRDVQAAQALLREGAGVFDVMSTGAAGLTATLGPLAMALAAVTAVAVTYNQTIAKAQNEGMAANAEAWANALAKVKEQGGGTQAILDAYAAGINRVNAAYESSGILADLFIDKQKIITNGLQATLSILSDSAGSWEEYSTAVQQAAQMAGYQVDEQGRMYTVIRTGAGLVRHYATDLNTMTKAEWMAAEATRNSAEYMDSWARATDTASITSLKFGQSIVSTTDILNTLQTALRDAGASNPAQIYEDIAASLGVIPTAAQQAAADVKLLSEAFAAGLIDQTQYVEYMQQAQEGILNLDTATRNSLQGMIDNATATREAAQAAADAAQKYWSLAEALKGAREAEFAKQMLDQLGELLKGDTPNVELYNQAYQNLALQYGFVSEKSMALANAIPTLTAAIQEGTLAPEQLSEAIKFLFQDAADGSINWDLFAQKFMSAPEAFAPAQGAIEQISGQISEFGSNVTSTSTVISTEFPKWVTTAQTTSKEIVKAFAAEDWIRVGLAISDGIARGIAQGEGRIIAAARAAAAAAYTAAAQELDIHSPSKKFEFLGEMALRGFEKPFLGNDLQPIFQNALLPTIPAPSHTEYKGVTVNNPVFSFADTTLTPEVLAQTIKQLEWMYG
jgi:tape measure domain-containing protein